MEGWRKETPHTLAHPGFTRRGGGHRGGARRGRRYWWKGFWDGHPTVEPFEHPLWKEMTFPKGMRLGDPESCPWPEELRNPPEKRPGQTTKKRNSSLEVAFPNRRRRLSTSSNLPRSS